MDCPDTFPWISLFGVVGTLFGAILGGWLGHWFATKQAADQREYEDRTRFHSERLKSYFDFLGASMSVRTLTAIIRGGSDDDDDTINARKTLHRQANVKLNEALGSLVILATEPVRTAAYSLWGYVVDLISDDTTSLEDANDVEAELTNTLRAAMRTELGIEADADD